MKPQLTNEQSQHLIDLGVPKEKASAFEYIGELEWDIYDQYNDTPINEKAPIFTLTDLLEILPKEIEAPIRHLGTINIFFLNILYFRPCRVSYNAEPYNYVLDVEYAEELIDALYKLCVWTIENGYLKF